MSVRRLFSLVATVGATLVVAHWCCNEYPKQPFDHPTVLYRIPLRGKKLAEKHKRRPHGPPFGVRYRTIGDCPDGSLLGARYSTNGRPLGSPLVFFAELLFQLSQSSEVTEGFLFYFVLNVNNSGLRFAGLFCTLGFYLRFRF